MDRPPLYRFPPAATGGSPRDDVRTLVELMRTGNPALVRRWVTALLRMDPASREALVAEAERRAPGAELTVVDPPRARDGYVERVERTYEVKPEPNRTARRARRA